MPHRAGSSAISTLILPPLWQNKTAFVVQSSGMKAVAIPSGNTIWTATSTKGSYSTPPIVVNGVVYVGMSSGYLLGYIWNGGKAVVSMNMGYPTSAYETGGVGSPESGLGAGQGILVVPASTHLIALQH